MGRFDPGDIRMVLSHRYSLVSGVGQVLGGVAALSGTDLVTGAAYVPPAAHTLDMPVISVHTFRPFIV